MLFKECVRYNTRISFNILSTWNIILCVWFSQIPSYQWRIWGRGNDRTTKLPLGHDFIVFLHLQKKKNVWFNYKKNNVIIISQSWRGKLSIYFVVKHVCVIDEILFSLQDGCCCFFFFYEMTRAIKWLSGNFQSITDTCVWRVRFHDLILLDIKKTTPTTIRISYTIWTHKLVWKLRFSRRLSF